MTSLGFFISGPFSHVCFRYIYPYFVEKILPKLSPKYFAKEEAFRIACACVLFDLIVKDVLLITTELYLAGLIESGWVLGKAFENVKEKLMTMMILNLGF